MNKFLSILSILIWIFNFYLYGELNYKWGQTAALHGYNGNIFLKNSKEVQDSIKAIPKVYELYRFCDSLVTANKR